jgi:hypothetical protein
VRAGIARYWQQAERAGTAKAPADVARTAEELERLRQLDYVRRPGGEGKNSGNGLETR